MRMIKIAVAAILAIPAAPVLACDLDGPGGHRYFAFANMYRGGTAEQPTQEGEKPEAREERTDGERDRQGGNGGSEPSGDNGSDNQSQDPSTFR